MLEKIKSVNLQEGMYVVCSASGRTSLPPDMCNNFIDSKDDITAILKLNVTEVLIDSSKTKTESTNSFPKTSYSEEILFAKEAYSNVLGSIQKIYKTIQRKAPLDINSYEQDVDPLLDSIERNNSASASLTVLARSDRYLFTHSLNTAILSAILGRFMGFSREAVKDLTIAAMLMNIGQVWLDRNIFKKNGKLNQLEYTKVKTHPQSGKAYLQSQKDIPQQIMKAVLHHHEKYDGSGYPEGIAGNEISKFARIISICDAYDAMTSDRPYREALTPNLAIKHLYAMAGKSFHPRYLENFIKCIGIYPVGCFVKLSDGRYAVVVENTPKAPLLPKVKIVFNSKFRAIPPEYVDLSRASSNNGSGLEIVECIHPKTFKLELERFLW